MIELRQILSEKGRFARGVELVTTRGTMEESKATATRDFGRGLTDFDQIDWVSITDNAGGNPQLSPMALGKPLLYAGKEVLIHLSCKDMNRNGLESAAWELASEGYHNLLALSGDYPVSGYSGVAKPVFDIDSIGLLKLLQDMNEGLGVKLRGNRRKNLNNTNFYLGCVATNIKLRENELVPQLLKLKKKREVGSQFVIGQIGFDSRKASEMIGYMRNEGMEEVPLIGNVFLMNRGLARFFKSGKIAGVVVSDEFVEMTQKHADKQFYLEFAAKQAAIFKGLGYSGAYYGGIENIKDLEKVFAIEATFSPDDWQTFAKEIRFSRPGEFFYYAEDEESGLSDCSRLNPEYERSLNKRKSTKNVTLGYRISKWTHDLGFSPKSPVFAAAKRVFENASNPDQGPSAIRMLEHASKAALFKCHDCGDCSLPDIAFLCPESSCAKNQRNGPCGGTRDGKCEVEEFECLWAKAYDRLKFEGREQELLAHAPVIQDQSLRGTSSWSNAFRGLDHHKLKPLRGNKADSLSCSSPKIENPKQP